MTKQRIFRAVGLMSGTSMDGVDAAYLETDGHRVLAFGPCRSIPFAPAFRERLRAFIAAVPQPGGDHAEIEHAFTDLNAAAVRAVLGDAAPASKLDLVGFHGQTIWHRPHLGRTWQMGDGARLARDLGVPVCFDFRSADVAAGGQGAPLAPVYHAALAFELPRPAAILNLGGVGNVTWIGDDSVILGFDTGPGNGLLDDWMLTHTGTPMDSDGVASGTGAVAGDVLAALMHHPYFDRLPPKSLDRFAFTLDPLAGLGVADGAATLAAFTAASVNHALRMCPAMPARVLVTGGGRHNPTIMRMLADGIGVDVEPIENIGCDGDHLEAQAFAFMAARAVLGLPISFPSTTGVPKPMPGGRIVKPG
ncbi:MAG: anhydro-N-acetylmuramic acid kinase [Alphaproteobacteria bacterium]|nr:anhydro-N-acetylmuramic acid kinase [Alphaproteobacteria bacterium]